MCDPVVIGRHTIAVSELIDEGCVRSIADDLAGRVILHHDEKDVIGLIGGEGGRRSGSGKNRGRQQQSGSRKLV